jgi:hypothetical protein
MDALLSILLLTIVLLLVGLMAAIVGPDSREDFNDTTSWRTFGPRF